MTEEESRQLCDIIRQTAYDLHVYLGIGYLEKVYENGQVPVQVVDEDGFVLGDYIADMIVDGIVVELKAVSTLLPAHMAQCLNYLKAMKIEYGLIINFGAEKFQCRKLALSRDKP